MDCKLFLLVMLWFSTAGAAICKAGQQFNGNCYNCMTGYYCPGDDSSYLCCPGTYSPNPGRAYCFKCTEGTYAILNGSKSCINCSSGYSSFPGSTTCNPCGPGYYSTEGHRCEPCPPETYSNIEGATSCTDCPRGRTHTFTGQMSILSCILCALGYYSKGDGACYPCKPGIIDR